MRVSTSLRRIVRASRFVRWMVSVFRKIESGCVEVKWLATSTSIGVCGSSLNS